MKRPNILLITSDQQHFGTIGAFNPEIQTPHLDRLVKEGMTFNRAYCPNPTCTPTRASILTGKYPSQHGAWTLGTKLNESETTIGELLQKEGYRTSLIGKAHFQQTKNSKDYPSIESMPLLQDLDFWRQFSEPFYGFEAIRLLRNHTNEYLVGQHYMAWMEDKRIDWKPYYMPPVGTMDPTERYTWKIPLEAHYNEFIVEETINKLNECKKSNESFFIWASFPDPHPPYLVPEPWASMYNPDELTIPEMVEGEHINNPPHFRKTQEQHPDFDEYRESGFGIHGYHSHLLPEKDRKQLVATYFGMISYMDEAIGKILDSLDELEIAEDTLVVFTTDHGHFYGQHGLQYKGGFHYEDLIKLPFIVRYPGIVPAGYTSNALQSLVDVAPTFLSFAGIEIPGEMSGENQKSVWIGNTERVRDHVLCEFRHEPTTIHQKTYVDERYKLTIYYNKTYGELFDLKDDPKELNNLWDLPESAELQKSLLLKYAWAELHKESMRMPRIANA